MSVKFDKYERAGSYHWAECDPAAPGLLYNPPLVARYRMVLSEIDGEGRVLDVGGGDGYLAGQIAERCVEVVVLDAEDSGVALAREQLAGFDNVTVMKGDAYKLPFEANQFDVVLMTDVIEHLDRPETAVAEAARVMAPQGKALLTTPQWRPEGLHDVYHVKEYKPEELAGLLRRSFSQVDMVYSLPELWSALYGTRTGWRLLKFAGRYGFNPFLKTSRQPAGFGHMLAVCRGKTKSVRAGSGLQ